MTREKKNLTASSIAQKTHGRDTVGKAASDLIIKQVDDQHSAVEQMQEQLAEYDANLLQCYNAGKLSWGTDFYIVVLTKKERILKNVLRNYFFSRSSCPTPEWDQTVYKYTKADDSLEFLWVIPSKDTCEFMYHNALQIPAEERMLLMFVLSFLDGSLLRKAKQLNGEQIDSPLLLEK
jgi:hypothetical protein